MHSFILLILSAAFAFPIRAANPPLSSLRWPLYHELFSGTVNSAVFYSEYHRNVSGMMDGIFENGTDCCLRNYSQPDSIETIFGNYGDGDGDEQMNRIRNGPNVSSLPEAILMQILQRKDLMDSILSESQSADCFYDLYYFFKSIVKRQPWALKALDAFGKLPAGLSSGNVIWAGDYDECLEVNAPRTNISFDGFLKREASFTGKYCLLQIVSKKAPPPPAPEGYLLAGLTVGICISKRCSENTINFVTREVQKIFKEWLERADLQFADVTCPHKKDYLDKTGILAIIILVIMLTLVGAGTMYEFFVIGCGDSSTSKNVLDDMDIGVSEQQNESNTTTGDDASLIGGASSANNGALARILTSFSLVTNGRRLFSLATSNRPTANFIAVTSTPSETVDLTCIHAIRFFSMAWIILGNTYYISFAISSNPLDRMDPNKRDFWFQAIIQATYACDTFFMISACLVATQFFLVADKYPQLITTCRFWVTFYLQRLMRITPPYMLILLVYVGLWKYVGSGPFWPTEGFEIDNCRRTWWSNLLYINNLVNLKFTQHGGIVSGREYCAGWTWYLANDMQFYLISPLVLFPLFKSRQHKRYGFLGWAVLATFIIGGLAVTGIIARVHQLPPNMFPADLSLRDRAEFMKDEVYFKPYPHLPCYAVGLILALALRRFWQQRDQQQGQQSIRKVFVLMGWSLSFSFAMAIIYGLWPQYRGHPFSVDLSACYVATSRFVFTACVAWVVFACLTGHGGILNKILSWPLFKPLSRLTFCAYLIHPMLLVAYFFSRHDTFYYTEFVMVWFFGSFLLFSYLAAIGVALVFESPFLTLNRRFIKRTE